MTRLDKIQKWLDEGKCVLVTEKEIEVMMPLNGEYFTLAEMQAAVGGYIEVVHLDQDNALIANEEGLIYGLYPNDLATEFVNSSIDLVGNILFIKIKYLK